MRENLIAKYAGIAIGQVARLITAVVIVVVTLRLLGVEGA